MKRLLVSIIILFFAKNYYSQELQFQGEIKPGNVIIASGQDIIEASLDNQKLLIEDRSIFLFGFDRDAEGVHYLKVKFGSGKTEIKEFKLKKRKYKIQRINNMKHKYVTPPKEELPRIENEKNMMKRARRKIGVIDSAFFNSGFIRPVKGGKITGIFGSQRILNGIPKSPHNGLDIAAPKGTPVYAMTDGKVVIAENDFYYNGNFVLIDHGQGLNSVYLHMSKLVVETGQFVKKGDKIGEIGTSGRSTGPHLHWGVQWHNKRIDPQCLLNISAN